MTHTADPVVSVAVPVACELGESPFWHPREQALYWCDIPAHRLYRHDPADDETRHWQFDTDVACAAPMLDGAVLLGMRDGLWRFDPLTGKRERLAEPPYDPACERFNDGKCDPQGRFWVGTLYEPREPALASLYCYSRGQLEVRATGITTSNGLGWSPNGRTLYWSDTKAHRIDCFDVDPIGGALSGRRRFAEFAPREPGQPLSDYGGRPDGAAVDVDGCYWVAMFEGARLLRMSSEGQVLREVCLPVQCVTMPCFGDADLKTIYLTTARAKRPADELARQPLAGQVLRLRVEVPGLPVNLFSH